MFRTSIQLLISCAPVALAVSLLMPGCASDGSPGPDSSSQSGAAASPRRILDEYARAVNEKNIALLASIVTPDVQWLSVSGTQVTVDIEGKQKLLDWTSAYFQNMPTVRSRLDGTIAGAYADDASRTPGKYIAAREHVAWTAKDGSERRQSSLVIFEFEKGLIRRVWYYPTER